MPGAKKYLRDLTTAALVFLGRVDRIFAQPSTVDRGKAVAGQCNALDFANDAALHGALGLSFTEIRKRKRAAERGCTE